MKRLVFALAACASAVPVPGAADGVSSASCALTLAVKNRAFDASAKPFDGRGKAVSENVVLPVFTTVPPGLIVLFR